MLGLDFEWQISKYEFVFSQFASQDVLPSGPNPWKVLCYSITRQQKGARATQPLEIISCKKL